MSELLADPALFAEDRGLDYDPTDRRALRALETASGLVRALCAQTFTRVADDAVEIVGNPTRDLYLPERPVVAVSGVTIRSDGSSYLVPASVYDLRPRGLLRQISGGDWGGYKAAVALTYTHGYEVIPDDIVEIVIAIAARKIGEQIATPDQVDAGLTTYERAVIARHRA